MKKFKSLKWYWKTLIILSVIVIITDVSLNRVVEYFADKQLKKIQLQLAGKYDFSYEDLDVNVLRKLIVLENFKFFSVTDSLEFKDKVDFELDGLYLHLNNYFQLAVNGELNLRKIGIYNPSIKFGQRRMKKSDAKVEAIRDTATGQKKDLFLKYLNIDEFVLENGKSDVYRLVKPDVKVLFVADLDINATGISLDFTNDSLFASASIKTLVYNASDIVNNDLKALELSIGNMHYDLSSEGFTIEKFHIKNKQSRKAFNEGKEYRSPWISVDIEKIEFDIFPWNVYVDGIFNLGKIVLTKPDIELFVDLNLPLSPKIKPMPSKMIRDVPVKFNLDSLHLIDATFVFMPKMKGENPGNVKLAPINGYLTHITNVPEYLVEDPKMKLDIDCKIWDEGDVEIYMEVDVPDKNDPMYVKGQVENLSVKQVENMIKNLFGIGVKSGYIDLLKFEYIADDVTSKGKVVFDYHDLELDLKQKAGKDKETGENKYKEKSNKFLNFFAKGAIRKDNYPEHDKYVPYGYIYRERIRNKAFSDALWGSIEVGLLDVAVKDAFFNSKKKYNKKEKKKVKKEIQTKKKVEMEKKKSEKYPKNNADPGSESKKKKKTKDKNKE